MKAYEIHNKPGLDALTLTERPDPTPGPGQVLLKMRAASLNYRDLLVVKGNYGGPGQPPAPIIPLSDGVGEVAALGAGVSRVKAGDRVAGAFMPGWVAGEFSQEKAASALGGGSVDGVLAEYVVLHEEAVVPVPEHLTDEEAATLPCAAVTAWYALLVGGALKPGETVLLLGTGGVSLFALQFAKSAGARVILTSSSGCGPWWTACSRSPRRARRSIILKAAGTSAKSSSASEQRRNENEHALLPDRLHHPRGCRRAPRRRPCGL